MLSLKTLFLRHALRVVVLLSGLSASRAETEPAAPEMDVRTFPNARAALRHLLKQQPRVIGLGEVHQTHESATIPSSLKRFTQELLPILRTLASDLVIETWVTSGNCGAKETESVKEIAKTTKRPKETENEILTLIRAAQKHKIRPHILEVSCAEYEKMFTAEGVDYQQLLTISGAHLRTKIMHLAAVRADPVQRAVDDALNNLWQSGKRPADRTLVIAYGGALHNDLAPAAETAAYSYAPDVAEAVEGHFLELDIFVPEYIEGEQNILRAEPWYPLFQKNQSRDHVVLIHRAQNSYVLIFRRQRAAD